MDDTRLAHDVVDRLAPFLSKLLAKHLLPSSADPRQQQIYALWNEIYPKIALRSGVMLAAKKTAEEDTAENREALSMQLALVFRTNTFLAARVEQDLAVLRGQTYAAAETGQARPETLPPRAGSLGQEYSAEQISCQVCGSHDESLRLVSYPFVFSLVVITFRRMFQGVYCSRHGNRYFFSGMYHYPHRRLVRDSIWVDLYPDYII